MIGNGIIKLEVVMIELTKRQRDILCTLIKADDYMTLDALAENFNVSNNITLIKKPSHGIKIVDDIEEYKKLRQGK